MLLLMLASSVIGYYDHAPTNFSTLKQPVDGDSSVCSSSTYVQPWPFMEVYFIISEYSKLLYVHS